MAKVGICDDSPQAAQKIAELVKQAFERLGAECKTVVCTDGERILAENSAEPFDVLFLDIDMPGLSGFDIAKELRDGFCDCAIVFVTSHSELVYDSLDFQPFNFIRKNSGMPLEKSIPRTVGKLIYRLRQNQSLLIEDKSLGKVPVRIRDILFLEACGHYLVYSVLEDGNVGKITARGVISEQEDFLDPYSFARAHKGFLVNLSHIRAMNFASREITLTGGIKIPIGKKYKANIEEKYSLFLRRKT